MGGTGMDAEGSGTGEVTMGGKEMTLGSGVEVIGVVSIGEPRVEYVVVEGSGGEGSGTGEKSTGVKEMSCGSGVGVIGVASMGEPRVEYVIDEVESS